MDPPHGEDLGHGVYASPHGGGELTVTSPRLGLPWRVAEGHVPGTAVLWHGRSYEVVGRTGAGAGERWNLRTWDESSAMRRVFRLDRESVQEIADRTEIEVRNRRARGWGWLLLPLLGFAPAALQKKWENEWGFAADRATQVSSLLELLVGTAGTAQMAAAAFGADFFIPLPLALPGPVLFVFGVVRLAMVFGDGEPVGSPLGAPFLLLTPKSESAASRPLPAIRSFDGADGVLVLDSPILRRDWDRDGLLLYRGEQFRLDRVEREGRSWIYRFTRDFERSENEYALRLSPPLAPPPAGEKKDPPPAFLKTMLMTAAVTLGPASDQQRWADELGIRAAWLTILSGTAELVGGIANLHKDLGSFHSWLLLFDYYLVGEGLLRLASAFFGRPIGSVLGWALRPLYRSWLPSKTQGRRIS